MLVYWLKSGSANYFGSTKDLSKRIRQHNGEIKGGAKCTAGRQWLLYRKIEGFNSWTDCLSFEWHLKRVTKKTKDKDRALVELMEQHTHLRFC
jgi:structure-specific endonuclease subunit SLX1